MFTLDLAALRARTLLGVLTTLQLVLAIAAWASSQRDVRLWALAGIAVFAFIAWTAALRRRQLMAGTPRSRIASAAQGYVELHGKGLRLDVNPLRSPVTGRDCLWYSYQVEEEDGDGGWKVVETDRSLACFVLDDGSANCMVDPEGAEVLTRHYTRKRQGNTRYTEWILLGGDMVYVLGNFVTQHPSQALDVRADVNDLLNEWKQDKHGLLRRFDLDRDGKIDEHEWSHAVRLARAHVSSRHKELMQQPELHLVRGQDAALFLITNYDPDHLKGGYLAMMLVQLAVFLGSLGLLAHFWSRF